MFHSPTAPKRIKTLTERLLEARSFSARLLAGSFCRRVHPDRPPESGPCYQCDDDGGRLAKVVFGLYESERERQSRIDAEIVANAKRARRKY